MLLHVVPSALEVNFLTNTIAWRQGLRRVIDAAQADSFYEFYRDRCL